MSDLRILRAQALDLLDEVFDRLERQQAPSREASGAQHARWHVEPSDYGGGGAWIARDKPSGESTFRVAFYDDLSDAVHAVELHNDWLSDEVERRR